MKKKLRKIAKYMLLIGILYLGYCYIYPNFNLSQYDKLNMTVYVVYISIMIECFMYSY